MSGDILYSIRIPYSLCKDWHDVAGTSSEKYFSIIHEYLINLKQDTHPRLGGRLRRECPRISNKFKGIRGKKSVKQGVNLNIRREELLMFPEVEAMHVALDDALKAVHSALDDALKAVHGALDDALKAVHVALDDALKAVHVALDDALKAVHGALDDALKAVHVALDDALKAVHVALDDALKAVHGALGHSMVLTFRVHYIRIKSLLFWDGTPFWDFFAA